MSFAENFKTARKKGGHTQQDIADMLGLNRTSISKYESGDAMPQSKMLQKISEIFEMSIDDLFR